MRPTEVHIERENGDRDVLYLCADCEGTIDDYAKVIRKRPWPARCERCGTSEGDAALDASIERARTLGMPSPQQRRARLPRKSRGVA